MTTDPHSPAESPGGNPSPDQRRGAIPEMIGKYRIERRLGEGGMGTVYLALDTEVKRLVALKVLRRERADNPTLIKRFEAEAKTASTLKHKNVVAVYDAGQTDGFTYIAMEFVDGIDVHDLVQRREVIPVRRSIDIIKQVASALQHAYERGVVHRDIKPSNLLIQRDGTVKLADLGLARLIDEASEAGITRDGTTVGTVDYMSPEQARNSRSADTRSDIYSLGCAWYHMLTGEPPYADGGLTQRLRLHAEGKPPDPRDLNPKVPEGIVAILNRMMAKNPDERYSTPAEVIKELDKVYLQRDAVAGQILAELDGREHPSAKSAGKARPNAIPLPARDPSLSQKDSTGAIVFPMRFAGTVIIGIALLGLAIYGWMHWQPSSNAEPVNVDFTGDPNDVRDPFAIQDEAVPNPDNKQAPPPQADPGTPDGDPSATVTPTEGDPVARVEPRSVTPGERDLARKPYLPDWAAASAVEAGRKGLTTVTVALPSTVGPNARPPTVLLKPHLDKLPAAGGILVLPGTGPFELNLAELTGHEHVVIKAGDAQRPAVFIRQQAGQPVACNVSASILELEGLELFFQVADAAVQQPATALHAGTGDLLLRDCSFQVLGNPLAKVVAFQVEKSSSSDVAAVRRVLMDRLVIAGPQLTALKIDADAADVVIRESLIVSGGAAAIQIAQTRASAAASQRALRLIGDTIVSQSHAVDLINGLSIGDVAPTHVTAIDSVFANTDAAETAAMLFVQNWPRTDGRFDNLNWESAGSAYQGWPRLVQHRDAKIAETIAADFTDWKLLWPIPGEEAQFHPTPWPATALAIVQPPNLKPFAPDTLPNPLALSLVGDRPGCSLESLHVAATAPPTETREIPPRPPYPAWVSAEYGNAEIIPVDLTKQDLGRFLSKTKLPPRVVIVAEGFGLRPITPFTITDRAVQIEFRQKGGDIPLKLVAATKNRDADNTASPAALMTVDGGRLDIVGGVFEMTAASNRTNLDWFLDVRNGGFSIQESYVTSLPHDSSHKLGLIRWQHDAPDDPPASPWVGVIRESFLVADGTLIQAHMQQRQLFVDNAVLASSGTIFSLAISGTPAGRPSTVVLRDSTFSTATNFFEITNDDPSDSRRAALGLFADRSIFGAPPHTGSAAVEPVMFADSTGASQWQVAWIGKYNGYADEIKKFVVTDSGNALAAPPFETGWRDIWGTDHIQSPLTKPGGVLFAAPLPTLQLLEPKHFTLHRSAEANAWEGKPLGANLAKITSLTAPKPSSSTNRPTTKPKGF